MRQLTRWLALPAADAQRVRDEVARHGEFGSVDDLLARTNLPSACAAQVRNAFVASTLVVRRRRVRCFVARDTPDGRPNVRSGVGRFARCFN